MITPVSVGHADGRKVQATCVVLRDYIRKHHKEGDALIPVRQLSSALGVSLPTVCGALRQLGLAGLLTVRHGERTRITAQALRTRVGILVPADLTHPNASEYSRLLTHHLLNELRRQGLDASFYSGFNMPWSFDQGYIPWNFLNDARCGHLDAVIVFGSHGPVGIELCESLNIPIVGLGADYPAHVRLDTNIAHAGASALLKAGCARLAMISWDEAHSRPAFERALSRRKAPLVPQWVRVGMATGEHPSIPGAGRRLFDDIWDACGEKPDGLVITDDVYVPDVVQAIHERGIGVPATLRIAAHHNKGSRFAYPFPVTLMENDPELQARHLAEVLLVRLGMLSQRLPVQRVLACTVIP